MQKKKKRQTKKDENIDDLYAFRFPICFYKNWNSSNTFFYVAVLQQMNSIIIAFSLLNEAVVANKPECSGFETTLQ